MVETPAWERLPCLVSQAAGDQLLRVAESERRIQDLRVAQLLESRQAGADFSRDRVIAVAVPAQKLFRLLSEIIKVGHGRGYG